MNYYSKYIKYKLKYNKLKNKKMIGGSVTNLEFETEQKNLILQKVNEFCLIQNNTNCKNTNNKFSISTGKQWNWDNIKKTFTNNPDTMKKYFDFRKEIIDRLISNIFTYFTPFEI